MLLLDPPPPPHPHPPICSFTLLLLVQKSSYVTIRYHLQWSDTDCGAHGLSHESSNQRLMALPPEPWLLSVLCSQETRFRKRKIRTQNLPATVFWWWMPSIVLLWRWKRFLILEEKTLNNNNTCTGWQVVFQVWGIFCGISLHLVLCKVIYDTAPWHRVPVYWLIATSLSDALCLQSSLILEVNTALQCMVTI